MADGITWSYRFNLACRPHQVCRRQTCIKSLLGFQRAKPSGRARKGGQEKLGFTDITWFTVRLQFCISKTAVNKSLGMKENI